MMNIDETCPECQDLNDTILQMAEEILRLKNYVKELEKRELDLAFAKVKLVNQIEAIRGYVTMLSRHNPDDWLVIKHVTKALKSVLDGSPKRESQT